MTFEQVIGLHEELRVYYVVDGYIAQIIDECTLKPRYEAWGPTVLQAVAALGQHLAAQGGK